MDNLEEKILYNLKSKIAVSNFDEKEMNMKKDSKNKVFKSIAVASILLISSTGLVFAKEIEKFIVEKFNLRTMHQSQVDNGYIATSEMDYIEADAGVQIGDYKTIVDTVNTKLKITDFMLTDDMFDFQVEMKFDEKINQYKDLNKRVEGGNIDYENFGSIELDKLFILDENNNLLSAPIYDNEEDEKVFYDFCDEHNLNYKYREYNENYLGNNRSIVTSSPNTIIPEENKLEDIIYSILPYNNSEDIEAKYPKSKHLTLYFSEITFVPKLGRGDEIHLIGDWKIDLDIPEIMQSREDIEYKVISCDNKDFNIISAVADETGFELELSINNVKKVEYPIELRNAEEIYKQKNNTTSYHIELSREGLIKFYGSEELADLYEKYQKESQIINYTGEKRNYWESESKGSYVVNSDGKEFKCGGSGSKPLNFKYETTYDENGYSNVKTLDIYEGALRFNLTKFDCTDKLTVYIEFKGEPVKIELEKVNK